MGRSRSIFELILCQHPGAAWAHFFTFFVRDGPLEWVRPIPKAPERSWHASGPSFSPNGRFWIHFGPFLMFLAQLENQVWAKTWPKTSNQASRFHNFARNAKSGFELTYFQAFPGNAKHYVGSVGSTLFFQFPGNATKHLQKKVPVPGPEKGSGTCRPG